MAKPVEKVDERIQKLVADMFETMYEARGIGLAATQVDVHERVVVMDLTEDRSEPRVHQPVIVEKTAKPRTKRDCLSCRALRYRYPRERVKVEALNEKRRKIYAGGGRAVGHCVQHELDHLMGIVFVERLSQLKQGRIKTKLKKRQETHYLKPNDTVGQGRLKGAAAKPLFFKTFRRPVAMFAVFFVAVRYLFNVPNCCLSARIGRHGSKNKAGKVKQNCLKVYDY